MKKPSSLDIYYTLLLCAIIFFPLNSCSEEVEIEQPIIEYIDLRAEKNQYAPYEIVIISTSEYLFTVSSFTAKINNAEIIISSNENIASFVLPNLINGDYDLSFTLNKKNYIVPITVSSLSSILSADQYFNEIQSGINQNINDLNSQINQLKQNSTNPSEYVNLQNDVIKYTNFLKDYSNSYSNLSASEKQEFAKTIAANKASIDEYNNLTSALYSSNAFLRTAQSVQDYEKGVEASMGAFVRSVIYTAGHIPFILAGTKLAAISLNPGVIIACGFVTGSFIINLSITTSLAASLIGKSLKPYEIITQTSQTRYDSGVETVSDIEQSKFNNQTSQTVYNSGVETASDIQAKYRSLVNSDSNDTGNGVTINTIVEKYNYFKVKYNGFINELPSAFRPSYVMTSLKNVYDSTTRLIHNQYVSFTNISNPNVTLQQLNQPDGSIKIKATTTSTTDQTFTYNVNYTNSNFTNGLTKEVNAKVITKSCDPNTIIGTWTVEMLNTCYPNPDGSPSLYLTTTLTLYQGGHSMLTYHDGTQVGGTYTSYADCSFSYNNLTWCDKAIGYSPSSPYYQSLHSCDCLSLKHTKQ